MAITLIRNIIKILLIIISAFFVFGLIVIISGYILFKKQWNKETSFVYQTGNVDVRASNQFYDSELDFLPMIIDKAKNKIENQNKIPSDLTAHLFFFSSYEEYKTLGISLSSTSEAHTFYNYSFFSPLFDLSNDDVKDESIHYKVSDVIVHEYAHIYQYEKFGYFLRFVDDWKIEGFADYVADNSIIDVESAINTFENAKNNHSDVYNIYFLGRLRTDYLLRHKGVPENEFWDTKYDTDKLDDEIREALQNGEYKAFVQ